MKIPPVGDDNPSAHLSGRKIASLPIGFFISGFLHLTILAALVVSLSKPIGDTPIGSEAPITLTLAMFAEPSTKEPSPSETPPQVEEIEKPKPKPVLEQKPLSLPKSKPSSAPKRPRPVPNKSPEPSPSIKTSPARRTATRTSPAATKPIESALAKREEMHYLAALRARIERKEYYPRASRRRREEGKVIVSFIIRKNGEVTDLAIVQSSGIRRLDDAALKTMRRVTPFKPIPPALGRQQWRLSIPISYSLTD